MVRGGTLSQEAVGPLLPDMSPRNRLALEVWAQLGEFDWHGIELLHAMHDFDDPGDLIERLTLIRNEIGAAA